MTNCEIKSMYFQTRKNYLKKTSELPAVEVAHPGASYNPAFDDHQVSANIHQVYFYKFQTIDVRNLTSILHAVRFQNG